MNNSQKWLDEKIEKVRSKYVLLIINTIYNRPGISHKELAEALGVTPSRLCAIVKLLEDNEIRVITVYYEGRTKSYTIAEDSRQIVGDCLKARGMEYSEHSEVQDKDYKAGSNLRVVSFIEMLREKEGERWFLVLDEMLIAQNRGEICEIDEEIQKAFDGMLEETLDVYLNGGTEAIKKLRKTLGSDFLAARLEEYINVMLKDYNGLRPLCVLEDSDWKSAYDFINQVLTEEYDLKSQKTCDKKREIPFEKQEVAWEIGGIILNWMEEARNHALSKEAAYQEWSRKLPVKNERICYYLAEKYDRYFGGRN